MGDKNIIIINLQNKIQEYIGVGIDNIIFDYSQIEDNFMLKVITINKRHKQSFLFHEVTGSDKIDCLKKMLSYVKVYKEKESTFTIQWSMMDNNYLNTSYFRGKNVLEVLDKFYYDRDPNSITVFSVILSPIA